MNQFCDNRQHGKNPLANSSRCGHARALLLLWVAFIVSLVAGNLNGAPATPAGFLVRGYEVQGWTAVPSNVLARIVAPYTGTNVSVEAIVQAAGDLEREYSREGYATMNIVIAPRRITNGVVTLDVFPGAIAQIVVSGRRYLVSSGGAATPAGTNGSPASATAPLTALAKLAAGHAAATNAGPRFTVSRYEVLGNTILPSDVIGRTLTNVPGAFGTNVSLVGIRGVATALQGEYRVRGYVTVFVTIPPQRLTNAVAKIQVTEGRLASIEVKGNHYFSSNNVMHSLPGLHTNELLNGLTFQAELNRANASQDRQIYPVIGPGPDPGTSDLTLKVNDRLPLHAKVIFNNESSPGTPDLRVNSSIVYDNLWQVEQSIGLQYSFSPEMYKSVSPVVTSIKNSGWNFYDQPEVANYSGFYRIPLGGPKSMDDAIASNPGSFGYDEATRKFNLPPASGQPEINFYASRSTIDTGLTTLSSKLLYETNGSGLFQNEVQQDLTVNNDVGFRLSAPAFSTANFHGEFSGGFDFKVYSLTSYKTNIFLVNGQEIDNVTGQSITNTSADYSPVPVTYSTVEYVPVTLRYDEGWNDRLGTVAAGLGLSANLWFSSSVATTNVVHYRGVSALQQITGSKESSGHWVILTPSYSHSFQFITNWVTVVRADGQWSSEPVISNEQFGAGGVNSVRGYHEGEVFGDNGWHVSLEQQTPPHLVGYVNGHTPLTVRGSIFTDYAETCLIDPLGRRPVTDLWGIGVGGVASVGTHWEARFLFSLPLTSAGTIEAYQPFFNFSLTGQF